VEICLFYLLLSGERASPLPSWSTPTHCDSDEYLFPYSILIGVSAVAESHGRLGNNVKKAFLDSATWWGADIQKSSFGIFS
jgi:hypothetical protein